MNDYFRPYKFAVGGEPSLFKRSPGYNLDSHQLFLLRFNELPNTIVERDIKISDAKDWLDQNMKAETLESIYFRTGATAEEKNKLKEQIFILDKIIVALTDLGEMILLFSSALQDKALKIHAELVKYRESSRLKKAELQLLCRESFGLDARKMTINKPRLSIKDNYNDDFEEVHQTITRRLRRKNDKGIVLLHGLPGTGKTSYLRYLISAVSKNVIFLPPYVASSLTGPDLLGFLTDHSNSILIIEDAEDIILDRGTEGDSAISGILNLADGLLSDCLHIQIICTFNVDISRIDNALLRKGRLISKYEFKELATEKAQRLSDKLGFTTKINTPMTLSDIYNQNENDFRERRLVVGF